jgi:hypothetical protein
VQAPRRAAEVQLFGEHDEITQPAQFHRFEFRIEMERIMNWTESMYTPNVGS